MALQIPIISEFNGKGIRQAAAEFKNLEGASKKTAFVLRKAMVPATAAIGGLAYALSGAVSAALDDQKAQAVLAQNLRKSTKATDDQIAAVEEFISLQGKLFGVTDDQLRPAFGKLALATGDLERAQRLVTVAQDIAASTGTELSSVVNALVKAERGQFTALRRLGIPMGKNTKAQVDNAKATERVEKAEKKLREARLKGDPRQVARAQADLKFAIDLLNDSTIKGADYARDLEKAFSGGAAIAAETTAGKVDRFKVAVEETREAIGEALLPLLERVVPYLQKFADWMQEEDNVRAFATAIGILAAAYFTLAAAQTAANLSNPVGAIVAAVAVIIATLAVLYARFQGFRDFMNPVINAFVTYWETIYNTWRQAINLAIRLYNLLPTKDLPLIPEFKLPRVGQEAPSSGGTNIPKMAKGGIVNRETLAIIGEAGPEAVIPLDRLGQMGGNVNNVTINVSGGDPNAVVDAITKWYRQNGPLPVAVRN